MTHATYGFQIDRGGQRVFHLAYRFAVTRPLNLLEMRCLGAPLAGTRLSPPGTPGGGGPPGETSPPPRARPGRAPPHEPLVRPNPPRAPRPTPPAPPQPPAFLSR